MLLSSSFIYQFNSLASVGHLGSNTPGPSQQEHNRIGNPPDTPTSPKRILLFEPVVMANPINPNSPPPSSTSSLGLTDIPLDITSHAPAALVPTAPVPMIPHNTSNLSSMGNNTITLISGSSPDIESRFTWQAYHTAYNKISLFWRYSWACEPPSSVAVIRQTSILSNSLKLINGVFNLLINY